MKKTILILFLALASIGMNAQTALPKVYNESIDPIKQIEQTVSKASGSKKFSYCAEEKADKVNRKNGQGTDCENSRELAFAVKFKDFVAVFGFFKLVYNVRAAHDKSEKIGCANFDKNSRRIDENCPMSRKRKTDGNINQRCGNNKDK